MTTSISNGNSTVNQRIKQEFVAKHVYCNVNQMVEYILRQDDYKNSPFTMEDVSNYYTYPEYYGDYANFSGGTRSDLDNEIRRLDDMTWEHELDEDNDNYVMYGDEDDDDDEYDSTLEDEIDTLINLESEPAEIFEWWMVSDFLCEKLEALGHPVISDHNIWGRCTTGQAILLDYTITQICSDMGILEGQENSWAI